MVKVRWMRGCDGKEVEQRGRFRSGILRRRGEKLVRVVRAEIFRASRRW